MQLTNRDYAYGRGKELFETFRKNLESKTDEKSKDLLIYLQEEESRKEEMKEKLDDYRDFFKTLSRFLPNDFSIHDPLF